MALGGRKNRRPGWCEGRSHYSRGVGAPCLGLVLLPPLQDWSQGSSCPEPHWLPICPLLAFSGPLQSEPTFPQSCFPWLATLSLSPPLIPTHSVFSPSLECSLHPSCCGSALSLGPQLESHFLSSVNVTALSAVSCSEYG